MVHQTTQRIPIASSPAGARVLIDSVPVGITPLVATVSRRRSHVVTLIHDSFPAASVSLERSISPWVLGNYMLYIVPAAVDFANGAAYGFPGDTVRITLSRSPSLGAPVTSGIPRVTAIPAESGATAIVTSLAFGFGSGHAMLGARASPFALTQFGGISVAAAGLGMGLSGKANGYSLWIGGATLYLGSRVWEIVDLVQRTDKHNRQVSAREQ